MLAACAFRSDGRADKVCAALSRFHEMAAVSRATLRPGTCLLRNTPKSGRGGGLSHVRIGGRLRPMVISLRPAVASDSDFAERVFFSTQRWIIERLFGWRGDEFEHRRFMEHYHPEITAIIMADEQPAGWLAVSWHADRAEIHSIYLLAAFQRLGIGSQLVRDVISEANRQNLSVCLSAAKINPARTLYERLGFCVVDESEFKVFMQYGPVALKHIDDPTLDELLKVAVLEAPPHEVMPLVSGESGWTPQCIAKFRSFHQSRRDGLEGVNHEVTYAIVHDGHVVGSARLARASEDVLETGLWLAQSARRRGIGTMTLRALIVEAARTGVSTLIARTTRNNRGALGILRRCGAELSGGYSENDVLARFNLEQNA